MHNNRINKIISSLNQQAYLVTDKNDLFYLTGLDLEGFWLLLTPKGFFAFTPPMFAGQLRGLLVGGKVIAGKNLINSIIELCKAKSIKTLGLDYSKVNHKLAGAFAGSIEIKNSDGLLDEYRLIKDKREIELVIKSSKIAVSALKYARRFMKPGVTELQIMFKIEEYFAKCQAQPAFPIIVAFGPNSANPHHISSARKIKKNDVILVDLGCRYKGYCSDLTRTLNLGKITNSFKEVNALVREAHDRAVKRVKNGVKASEVDAAARQVISDGGYADNFVHTTGHGLGIEVHEPPRLSVADGSVLKSGMFVTVEPGIYLPGKFGVRHENLLLVNEKGNEVLTDDFDF